MLLLVEDNEYIIKGLVYSIKQNNYDLVVARNLKEAKEILDRETISLCILDIMLPDGNGKDFYRSLDKHVPTIFLTAVDDEEEIVEAFELGADDYLTKPFRTKELLARIKKIMSKSDNKHTITIKDITFDIDKMAVYKKKEMVNLTSLELQILLLFFKNVDSIITREMLVNKIWELTGNDVYDNTVTVYLKRIREKIGDDLIITIKGIGYRIDDGK